MVPASAGVHSLRRDMGLGVCRCHHSHRLSGMIMVMVLAMDMITALVLVLQVVPVMVMYHRVRNRCIERRCIMDLVIFQL